MTIPAASAATVSTSCTLLKFSLSTSNVCEGATLDEKRSRPYANTNDVDSRSAGDVTIRSMFFTYNESGYR